MAKQLHNSSSNNLRQSTVVGYLSNFKFNNKDFIMDLFVIVYFDNL